MTRPKHSEVALIQGRQLRFVETFDDSEHGGIDEPDVGILVTANDVRRPSSSPPGTGPRLDMRQQ